MGEVTDLERVRDFCSPPFGDSSLVEDIDAHLKEDAEREAMHQRARLHLTELAAKKERRAERAEAETRRRLNDEDDAWLKDRRALEAELAEVREEIERWRKEAQFKEDERVRLREALKYAQGGQYMAVMQENVRLREALEDIASWTLPGIPDLETCRVIARNALKETT